MPHPNQGRGVLPGLASNLCQFHTGSSFRAVNHPPDEAFYRSKSQMPISPCTDAVIAPQGKRSSSTKPRSRRRKRDESPRVIISGKNAPKPTKIPALHNLSATHIDESRTSEARHSGRDGCDVTTNARSMRSNSPLLDAESLPEIIRPPCPSNQKNALDQEKKSKKSSRGRKNMKASRKQAVRAVKTLPSVEQLLQLPLRTPTSSPAAGDPDSDWSPSRPTGDNESVAISTPRSIPPRRSSPTAPARTQSAIDRSASSSPLIAPLRRSSMSVVKKETTEPLEQFRCERASIRPKSPSLSIFDSEIRRHKLEENGFVEQPESEHPLLGQVEAEKEIQAKRAHLDYIEAEKEAEAKKALWKKQEWRVKIKKHLKPLDQEKGQSTLSKGKRKAEFDDEDTDIRMRGRRQATELKVEDADDDGQNVTASKYPSMSFAHEGTEIESVPTPDIKPSSLQPKEINAQASTELISSAESCLSNDKILPNGFDVPSRSSKVTSKSLGVDIQAGQPSRIASGCSTGHGSGPRANQSSSERVGGSARQLHHRRGETRTLPGLQVWRKSYARREVVVPNRKEACVCDSLPDYFLQRRDHVSLASWGAGKAEFMAHVEQINQCPGHSSNLIKSCRRVLAEESRAASAASKPDDNLESALDFAQSYLSPESSPNSHRRGSILNQNERAQSSIAPPNFYGSPRAPKNHPANSRHEKTSTPTRRPFAKSNNRPKPHPSPCRNNKSTITPPASSPLQNLGQEVNSSTEHQSANQSSVGENRASAGALSGPHASTRPLQELSANVIRKRHQSMPANPVCRTQRVSQGSDASSASRAVRDRMLERMPIQDGLLVGSKEEFARILKDVLAEHMPQPSRAIDRQSDSTGSASSRNLPESQPQIGRMKRMSLAQRKIKWPEYSRHVPFRDRLSDEDLINVG